MFLKWVELRVKVFNPFIKRITTLSAYDLFKQLNLYILVVYWFLFKGGTLIWFSELKMGFSGHK